MATSKVTFTLDKDAVQQIAEAAELLKKPKSQIVREAIAAYRRSIDRVTEAERLRRMAVLERVASRPVTRTQAEVDAEIEEIRHVRRLPGRLHPTEP